MFSIDSSSSNLGVSTRKNTKVQEAIGTGGGSSGLRIGGSRLTNHISALCAGSKQAGCLAIPANSIPQSIDGDSAFRGALARLGRSGAQVRCQH